LSVTLLFIETSKGARGSTMEVGGAVNVCITDKMYSQTIYEACVTYVAKYGIER
jgi:hypothetical protein